MIELYGELEKQYITSGFLISCRVHFIKNHHYYQSCISKTRSFGFFLNGETL